MPSTEEKMETSTALPAAASTLGISFDGRAYHYQQFSYDRYADALGYAQLDQARPGWRQDPTRHQWRQWVGPTPQERVQMAAHQITYEGGYYRYGPWRYDLLAPALDYAMRAPGLQPERQAAQGDDERGV
jgi:hypothetical protein